jgi:hypothetical protein
MGDHTIEISDPSEPLIKKRNVCKICKHTMTISLKCVEMVSLIIAVFFIHDVVHSWETVSNIHNMEDELSKMQGQFSEQIHNASDILNETVSAFAEERVDIHDRLVLLSNAAPVTCSSSTSSGCQFTSDSRNVYVKSDVDAVLCVTMRYQIMSVGMTSSGVGCSTFTAGQTITYPNPSGTMSASGSVWGWAKLPPYKG